MSRAPLTRSLAQTDTASPLADASSPASAPDSSAAIRGASSDVRAAAGMDGPTAGAAPAPQTLLSRYPNGIPVSIHLQPTDADKANWTEKMRAQPTISEAIKSMGNTMAKHDRHKHLFARADADTPQTIPEDVISTVVKTKFINDSEFGNKATGHAQARASVALIGGKIVQGKSMPFTRQDAEGGAWKDDVQGVSAAVGPLPQSKAAATPGGAANISELAIFTHGGSQTLDLGSSANASDVVSALFQAVAPSINIQVYACNAGGGDLDVEGNTKEKPKTSFAEGLAQGLSKKTGGDVSAFSHLDAGHTTDNADGRLFRYSAGQEQSDQLAVHTIITPTQTEPAIPILALHFNRDEADIRAAMPGFVDKWVRDQLLSTKIDIRSAQKLADDQITSDAIDAAEAAKQAETPAPTTQTPTDSKKKPAAKKPKKTKQPQKPGPITATAAHALALDFDGTVALIRAAWAADVGGLPAYATSKQAKSAFSAKKPKAKKKTAATPTPA